MSNLIHYTNCPVCDSDSIQNVFEVKDYTVSGKLFQIAECNSCSLRFTQDVPDEVSMTPYYKSEDYISHTNTSKGLVNRLYHFVRNRTLKRKRNLIQKATGLKTGKILDIGAGTGAFLSEMKKNDWIVRGLEPDEDARKIAEKDYGIDLSDIKELQGLEPSSFDAITLWHVLEHIHDLKSSVIQLKILLKEKGKLFIAVPNYTSADASIYGQYWAAYDVPRHLYHFSPEAMKSLMDEMGLKIVQYKPMWYDSFYISLLSSRYKNGKTNFLTAFWSGFYSNLKALLNTRRCSSIIYIIEK